MMAAGIRPNTGVDPLHQAAPRLAAESERRFRLEWTRDGLPDLFLGLLLLNGTAFGAAMSWSSARFPWTILLLPFLGFAAMIAIVRAFFVLKARVSDPRVGYVRPRVPFALRSRWIARGYFLAFVIGGGLMPFVGPPIRSFIARWGLEVESWMPLLGLVPGLIVILVLQRWFGTTGHLCVGVVALLGSVVALLLGLSLGESVRWVAWPTIGVGHVVIGAVAFRSFLRTHPMPASP